MLILVDMREVKSELLNGGVSRFAFWDDQRAGFVRLGCEEAWQTWDCFEATYRSRYREGSVLRAPWTLDSFRSACLPWVFEPGAPS